MQHHCRDRVHPPGSAGEFSILDEQVGFGANHDRTEVIAPQGQRPVASREEEGLLRRYGVASGKLGLLEHVQIALVARLLQPDAGLVRIPR